MRSGPVAYAGLPKRKPYPSDVSDEEWAFSGPLPDAGPPGRPRRVRDLREAFGALRWIVRPGAPRRMLPDGFPRGKAVYHQAQRWLAAGVFEAMVHDLREVLLGLKAVLEDNGEIPGLGAATIRIVLRIVDGPFSYPVAFVTVLISGKNQRLGDMAAHILVVRK